MTESDIFDEYQRMWDSFRRCCEAANSLNTPNPEDDIFIKMAIVGFSHHQKTESWEHDNYRVAKQYLDEGTSLGDSETMRKFNLLALGALMGLYASGKIDQRVYSIGYCLLPGFVLGKGGAVENL